MSRRRTAIITAFTVEVSCPHCGESLPSPTGSFFWELREVAEAATVDKGDRTCDSCDEPLRISYQSRVSCDPIAVTDGRANFVMSPPTGEES